MADDRSSSSPPGPQGRTAAPPQANPHALPGAAAVEGATSLYEPGALGGGGASLSDLPIIDAADLVPVEGGSSRRARAPTYVRAERPRAPEELEPVRELGPIAPPPSGEPDTAGYTMHEAVPAPIVVQRPPAPVTRTAIVRNAPPPPVAKRRAKVRTGPMCAASAKEQSWVMGGNTGLGITIPGPDGRPRLIAVNLAYIVTSYEEDADGNVTVYGKIRWHGLPPADKERQKEWAYKLQKWHNGERRKQLMAALEQLFAYVDPRAGLVVRFLGGPATDMTVAARNGYQWYETGSPAVKVETDLSLLKAEADAALAFYLEYHDVLFLGIRRVLFWSAEENARFGLGEKHHLDGAPPPPQVEDGLDANQRRSMMGVVAELAGPVIASLGKIAWRGDEKIEKAMQARDQVPVAATRLTLYEPEGDGMGKA